MILRLPSTLVLSRRRMCYGSLDGFPWREFDRTHLELLVGLGNNERHLEGGRGLGRAGVWSDWVLAGRWYPEAPDAIQLKSRPYGIVQTA